MMKLGTVDKGHDNFLRVQHIDTTYCLFATGDKMAASSQ